MCHDIEIITQQICKDRLEAFSLVIFTFETTFLFFI